MLFLAFLYNVCRLFSVILYIKRRKLVFLRFQHSLIYIHKQFYVYLSFFKELLLYILYFNSISFGLFIHLQFRVKQRSPFKCLICISFQNKDKKIISCVVPGEVGRDGKLLKAGVKNQNSVENSFREKLVVQVKIFVVLIFCC